MPANSIDSEILRQIIQAGDAEALVKSAEPFARALVSGGLKSSQLRNIFGEARKIQAKWRPDSESYRNDLILLKPKLAYQAARFRTRQSDPLTPLTSVLSDAIDLAIQDRAKERDRFQNFMNLFEAVVAYHKASGGDEEGR